MSEHTPQHQPTPSELTDPAAIDQVQADLVPGSPPVPITVWRTARTEADAGRSIGARLAARLVAAYSRPGDAVVDLTYRQALTHACTAGMRSHHPAWFTDDGLVIGPATPPAPTACADAVNSVEEGEDVLELKIWFGDDLTDPGLQPSGDGLATPAPGDGELRGTTSLVVTRWPLDGDDAANRIRLSWLLTGCEHLLRPGGCLILVITSAPGAVPVPEDFSGVVQAAAAARLGYLQHLVAIAADTDGDAFVYNVTDEELLALADETGRWQAEHLRVHADLLVFSQIIKTDDKPGKSRRTGGDHRV